MAENKSISSDCYEERCYAHDQGIAECARGAGFATVYELLGTSNQAAKRTTHKWREFYRDIKCAILAADYTAGDLSFSLDSALGFAIGDELHVDGKSVAYPVTGVSADGLTITVAAPLGDDADIATGAKITGINCEGECVCEVDICKPAEPEEKFNHVQTFRSCAISASKHAQINAKNGAYLSGESIIEMGIQQEVYNMLKEIDRAMHYGIRTQVGDKRKMGGILYFLQEAGEEICIDALTDFVNCEGDAIVPTLTDVVNEANCNLLSCGGIGANTIMAHPKTIQAFSKQGSCLDNCNKSFDETRVGNAPALTFRANLAGINGTNQMSIIPNTQIPEGEMWVGNINSVKLLSLEGCPMRLKKLNTMDPECPVYQVQAELTLELANAKCNWRRIKNLKTC